MSDYLANRPTKIIAIKERFTTLLYHQHVPATEYRKLSLSSRSEQLGHDILAQLDDLTDNPLQCMDDARIGLQVLSFTQPGAQGFSADVAIPLARCERSALRSDPEVSGPLRRGHPNGRSPMPP